MLKGSGAVPGGVALAAAAEADPGRGGRVRPHGQLGAVGLGDGRARRGRLRRAPALLRGRVGPLVLHRGPQVRPALSAGADRRRRAPVHACFALLADEVQVLPGGVALREGPPAHVAARVLLGEQEESVLLLGGEGAHRVLQEGRGEAPLEVCAGDPLRAFALGGGRRDEGATAAEEPLPRGLAQLAHGGLLVGIVGPLQHLVEARQLHGVSVADPDADLRAAQGGAHELAHDLVRLCDGDAQVQVPQQRGEDGAAHLLAGGHRVEEAEHLVKAQLRPRVEELQADPGADRGRDQGPGHGRRDGPARGLRRAVGHHVRLDAPNAHAVALRRRGAVASRGPGVGQAREEAPGQQAALAVLVREHHEPLQLAARQVRLRLHERHAELLVGHAAAAAGLGARGQALQRRGETVEVHVLQARLRRDAGAAGGLRRRDELRERQRLAVLAGPDHGGGVLPDQAEDDLHLCTGDADGEQARGVGELLQADLLGARGEEAQRVQTRAGGRPAPDAPAPEPLRQAQQGHLGACALPAEVRAAACGAHHDRAGTPRRGPGDAARRARREGRRPLHRHLALHGRHPRRGRLHQRAGRPREARHQRACARRRPHPVGRGGAQEAGAWTEAHRLVPHRRGHQLGEHLRHVDPALRALGEEQQQLLLLALVELGHQRAHHAEKAIREHRGLSTVAEQAEEARRLRGAARARGLRLGGGAEHLEVLVADGLDRPVADLHHPAAAHGVPLVHQAL
mmetsp:Transcript_110677/g.238194  ORF Transcript_110677/g.238194 Transcript_110677/m.238194 type:complete len:740 (-) Transcript_110677:509-2728(-)